jgi:hypothetical protein
MLSAPPRFRQSSRAFSTVFPKPAWRFSRSRPSIAQICAPPQNSSISLAPMSWLQRLDILSIKRVNELLEGENSPSGEIKQYHAGEGGEQR